MMRDETDEHLARAKREGAPLVDDGAATFVWEGDAPPQLIGDFNYWTASSPATRFEKAAPRVWTYTIEVPSDAYLEYSYVTGDECVHDPLNANVTSNGVGGSHNWFAMPDFEATPLTEEQPGAMEGTVTQHDVKCGLFAVGDERRVHLYQPPIKGPGPLLVVFDGQDYLQRGRLVRIVDNLIAEKRIRPINMALVDHANQARFVEYNCSDATVRFLERIIFPLAGEHLDLVDDPSLNGVLGASMGGLMALYAALRAPKHFGRVLSQSGAFFLAYDDFESVIYDVVRHAEARPAIWMDVGGYERLVETNRAMYDLLIERGHNVTYREYHGGHNYASWRNDVWRGIEALYQP